MTVQIEQAVISSGTVGSVFDNDGGLFRVNQLQVMEVTAGALIATANNGASFLEEATITASNMDSITFTTAGASQSVLNTFVTQMNFMEDAFFVEDVGSVLQITGTTLQQNVDFAEPWTGVSARNGATARVSQMSISDNGSVEFGVVSFGSTVLVERSVVSRNTGSVSYRVPEI
jgi:hypothetical protein